MNNSNWNLSAINIFKLFLLVNFLFIFKSLANDNNLENIEFKNINAHQTQLIIKTSAKTNFKVYTLKNPYRLIIDLENVNLPSQDLSPTLSSFVKDFSTKNNEIYLKLIFTLQKKIAISKSFFDQQSKSIIVKIDHQQADLAVFLDQEGILENTETTPTNSQPLTTNLNSENNNNAQNIANQNSLPIKKSAPEKLITEPKISNNPEPKIIQKIPVIVIDSGHGGKDPGTIGNYLRSKEKNITLSFAKELYKQLKLTNNYKVFLTRHKDVFINLKKRVALARQKKADLFISLHANAINDEDITGFSIYTLSEQSSDKQAELLAKKENQADIINGVNFSGASVDIMKTLIDMSQRSVKNESAIFANKVIKNVKQDDIEILQNTHRFAGFAVLTAPDMASVLIELGYLSNPNEEKLLNSLIYKRKVCESLVKAVEEYFSRIKN